MTTIHNDDYLIERCPACGEPGDYCLGHGMTGDPLGYSALQRHDTGDHTMCHPDADCTQLPTAEVIATTLGVVAVVVLVFLIGGR